MNTIGSLTQAIQRRPWSSAQDAALLAAALAVGFLLALEYEIVAFWDEFNSDQKRVRVEEMGLLTIVLGAGIFAFVLRRLHEERRDMELRLRSELELHQVHVQALQDPLTELPNRRAIKAALDAGIARADGLVVYLLDLNGFKRVNDEEGHAVGDDVLKAAAQRFRAVARSEDIVARIGGDEFAVLARDVRDRYEALEIGLRFVAALKSPVVVSNRSYALGVAVGVAFHPEDGVTGEDLLRNADAAMYSAKATRRSELHCFSHATARSA